MSLQYAYTPVVQFFDNDRNPLSNGELWTFNSITSASIQTYQDFLGTLNPTHVPLNSRGEAVVILDTAIVYKFALIPPNGDISDAIWIKDNIRASYGSTSPGSDITVVGTDGEVDVAQSSDGPTGVIYTVSLAQAVKDSLTSLANCVFYSAQSKTSSEQAIARTNIDVMSSSETMGAIQSAVASAVKLMGSATVAEINALANPVQGWLYQITDSGTITLGNVSVSAGDNIVYSSENSAWFKYYASIDLSSYYTKVEVNAIVSPIEVDIDTLQTDVDIVESDVAALKLSDQYTTFKANTAAGSNGYTFKIATALKTKAPLTSTTILEYDLTNNYLGKINAAWGMRGHVVYQQIMQMDDQYTAVDYMHYTHLYEFSDRWELWGHTAAAWAGDISIRPSKNISINTTVHVNPWVFVGKAVSASLPSVYVGHNWVDYTMPVNDSKKTSVWAEGVGTSDHKVMIDANDQGAKYLNDKILTGGILSKAIEAAGEVGDWYEVLRLTATLYTDGVTCRGAGTITDPLVALSDHESFVDIDSTNSPYLILESDNEIIVSTSIDDVIVTLPVTSLKRFYVKWLLGTHNLTVNVADSGMIDGVASFVFNDKFSVGASVSFVCKESGDWIANGTITDGQVDTYKAMCSTGDVPGYLENKLVGSTWIDVTEIPLSADEKNIKFALKNPDFFVKGNTIYGGQVVGVIGDLDEQSHNGYYTCYYNTLHAPPAQTGNPSWFIHHMNSNTANYYAVQIAYAYTSTIICYERTKVAGVWQAWILRSSSGQIVYDAVVTTGEEFAFALSSSTIKSIRIKNFDTAFYVNKTISTEKHIYGEAFVLADNGSGFTFTANAPVYFKNDAVITAGNIVFNGTGIIRLRKLTASVASTATYSGSASCYYEYTSGLTSITGCSQSFWNNSNTGVGTGEVKVTSAGVAGYLANKLTVAPGSPLTATVSGDTLVLDFLENNVADPLIRTLDLLAENGTCELTGSCWSSEGSIEGGNWGGLEQNTSDSFYKIVPLSRGTVAKAAVYIAQVIGTDSYYGSGNYGAIRLGLFAADGTLKGQTAWTRGISAIGRLTLDLTAAEGQNLTIERNTQYWVGLIGRGLSLLSNNKSSSSVNLSSLRYSVQIRTSSSGASWEAFTTDGSGYVQKNIMIAQMSATEESA